MTARPTAWLVFEDKGERKAVALRPPGVVVGRDRSQCDVSIEDFGISRRHARIGVEADGGLRLVVLEAKGGTQVNDVLVLDAAIAAGDRLRLGGVQALLAATPPPYARVVEPSSSRYRAYMAAHAAPAAAQAPAALRVDVGAEVERFFDDPSLPGEGSSRFVLLLGGISSGKTYTRRRRFKDGHVIVDAAEIFISLSRGGYYDFPDGLLEPMETIGALVALRAVQERRNIVTEMLAIDRRPIDALFRAMTSIAYHVDVVWIECDPAEGARRNAARGDLDISSALCQEYHVKWLLAAVEAAGSKRP